MSLPPSSSDNISRVDRIIDFYSQRGYVPNGARVLDVGSGLCVFLAKLKLYGFECHCVDPSELSVRHAINVVGVDRATVGDFLDFNTNLSYELVTFNKVLEHVIDPIVYLEKARDVLSSRGYVYIELPDGEAAEENGGISSREEFTLDHWTIYCPNSVLYLAHNAGFRSELIGRLHEPSGKYTIFAFLSLDSKIGG